MSKARTLPTMGQPQPGRPIAPAQAATQADGPRTLQGALLVPIEQITPDPDQPRKDHGTESLAELAASLTEYGMLQPLLVREAGLLDDGRTRYMIVAGGRRYAAALLAGLARLPLLVRESEGATLRITQLVENIQRQDLAPLEEARAFQELMDAEGLKAPDLSKRLHISEQTVRDRLLLLSDQPIADAVQRGQIGTAVARDILRAAPAPQAALRARVDAGEAVTRTDVQDARARAEAAGVTNPRKTGGGRRKATPAPSVDSTGEHNSYAPLASVSKGQEPGQAQRHNSYAPDVAAAAPLIQAAVHALAEAVEAGELRVYTDAKKAKDAHYRIVDDSYVAGFVAALAAMRRAVE
jgi:ParB family chromosome partitioning protein